MDKTLINFVCIIAAVTIDKNINVLVLYITPIVTMDTDIKVLVFCIL